MPGMSTYPFKDGARLTLLEQDTIQFPEVRIGLHLEDTLRDFDGIVTVAIDGQWLISWGETQCGQNGGDLGTIICGVWGFGNMAGAFDARGIFRQFFIGKL